MAVYRNSRGRVKSRDCTLAVSATFLMGSSGKCGHTALGCDLADDAIVSIGDIHGAVVADGDAAWPIELRVGAKAISGSWCWTSSKRDHTPSRREAGIGPDPGALPVATDESIVIGFAAFEAADNCGHIPYSVPLGRWRDDVDGVVVVFC